MRRKDKETNDSQEIEKILTKSKVGVVGMVVDNVAYSVPINFIYYQKCIYFHSANEGKKIQALKENRNVSFLTFINGGVITDKNPCKATQSFKSIMIEGRAEFVRNIDLKMDVFHKLVEKYYPKDEYDTLKRINAGNFTDEEINGVEVIKININNLTCKIGSWSN